MLHQFRNRIDAGRQLADKLGSLLGSESVMVLALPRGGVPVGAEVAKALRAPFRTFVVRKLGVPGHEEFGFGAVASGGIVYINQDVTERLGLSPREIRDVITRESNELERRERMYGSGAVESVHGRNLVLVDDGVATGSTLKVAIKALRQQEPAKIIVAVPVAPASARPEFESLADEFITVAEPVDFMAVGEWYLDFSQTSDEEVASVLKELGDEDFAHF